MLRIMIVIFTLQKLSSVMEHYSNVVLMLLLLSLCFATIQGFFLKVSLMLVIVIFTNQCLYFYMFLIKKDEEGFILLNFYYLFIQSLMLFLSLLKNVPVLLEKFYFYL